MRFIQTSYSSCVNPRSLKSRISTSGSKMRITSFSPCAVGSVESLSSISSRSEERRVGKECRYRWAADHEKKKDNRKNRRTRGNTREKVPSHRGEREG